MEEEEFLLEDGNYSFQTNLPASFYANTEADTHAKLLIDLRENGLYRV